jgi:hypothetical protein
MNYAILTSVLANINSFRNEEEFLLNKYFHGAKRGVMSAPLILSAPLVVSKHRNSPLLYVFLRRPLKAKFIRKPTRNIPKDCAYKNKL